MGEAREVMDRLMKTLFEKKDPVESAKLYASDAIAITPDGNEMKGPEIAEYLQGFFDAFPDATYETVNGYESGNVAIDEGIFRGTNTGELSLPDGSKMPATGKHVTARGCDIVTVENGMVKRHAFYFDNMSFMAQLGLMPENPS